MMAIGGRPKPEFLLLAGAVEENALAQGVLQPLTQWSWIKHPTFQLRGKHFTTELSPPSAYWGVALWCIFSLLNRHYLELSMSFSCYRCQPKI